jgi:hypothetical protein
MLRAQKHPVVFSGGLDAELFREEHADLLRTIKLGEAWFACDYPGAIRHLEKVAALLPDISARKKRCYVLIGFKGERIEHASDRLETIYNLGFWPFAMLYRSPDMSKNKWSPEWRSLQKTWCRPAAFKTKMSNPAARCSTPTEWISAC